MKTAVTMLGEAFRQWQKDWDSYDKGIGDKPKSFDEFISPFIEPIFTLIFNLIYDFIHSILKFLMTKAILR